ncbi:sigma-70 family RNA polymerase sigma factor [Massilia sp. TWR1-2-2]|uniref:sigma-70 family RNA polymerase sigma factor n=1 Tax=Massilia sp. TWR1-2-2 TaxID=2804584 RepID=UPI003CFA929F
MNDTIFAGMHLNRFLRMAAMAGIESAIRIHIDRGDDLNARDGNGLTPLMLSAARNRFAVCKLLVEAGADKSLRSPSGTTAHEIAIEAGAHEAAEFLEPVISTADVAAPPVPPVAELPSAPLVLLDDLPNVQSRVSIGVTATTESGPADDQTNLVIGGSGHITDFDLMGWEPEEDGPPPDADPSVELAASAMHTAISGHEPIDSSEDWDEVDVYLPERSMPLARKDDAESRERLRLLLLRAIREGSVPSMHIEALSLNDDRSANPEAEAVLNMVVNDLGAEVDERFEYVSVDENFEVFIKPEETQDEEEILAGAIALVDNLTARQTDPLRIYQKEFQRVKLISADDEVSLAKSMEHALDLALDALAGWPRGVELTLAAGHLVKAGRKPLTWLSRGPGGNQTDLVSEVDGDIANIEAPENEPDDEIELSDESELDSGTAPPDIINGFAEQINRLEFLLTGTSQPGPDWLEVREMLTLLQLNIRFLSHLADVTHDDHSEQAEQYAAAIRTFRGARERMANANLKLVFHLAKKYLYSGEPLDDLAQEGNIGLLKAVERFDWRRGFKFSTYATWWIRQQIGRHVADKGRTIRVPVHVHEKVQRLYRETRAFESENGRLPALDEIAARLQMSPRSVEALQRIGPEPDCIDDLLIDDVIAVEARSAFISPDPSKIAYQSELGTTIDKVLATLTPREQQIIRMRFGVGISDSFTLDEIGIRYEVTRERIRQIEAKAIRKLKHPSRADALSYVAYGWPFHDEREVEECNPEPDSCDQSSTSIPSETISTESIVAPVYRASRAKTPSIDRLLGQASNLGIPFADERNENDGKLWINFTEVPNINHRKFMRKLLALGFEFQAGKGYWR